MTNPLTQIQAAAASVGITAAVEVGDVQDLNLILDDQVEFPLVALVRVGVDGERKFLRPDGSAGYDLQWQCLLYVLDKSDIDDTGADRNTALNTLYDTALQLVSQLQIDGATSFQMQQPKRASFSAMPYNYFDLNVDGVIVALSIPDSFANCPPVVAPTPSADLALYAWDAGDIAGTTQTLTFSATGETIDVSTNALDWTSGATTLWENSTASALQAAGYTYAKVSAARLTADGNKGAVWIWGLPENLGTVTLTTSSGSFVASLENDVTFTTSECMSLFRTASAWYNPAVNEFFTYARIIGASVNPQVLDFSINLNSKANWPAAEAKLRQLIALERQETPGTEAGYAKLIDAGGEEAYFVLYGINTGAEPLSEDVLITTGSLGEAGATRKYSTGACV